jgi:hypothetical protein
MKYSLKITYPNGIVAYMDFRGRTSWCRSQAYYHKKTWVYMHGVTVEVEPN